MTLELIFAISAAIGGLTGLATMILSRRKLAAEAESITWQTVTGQLAYVDGEMVKLRAQLVEAARTEERLSGEIRKLRGMVRTLLDFIEDQGLTPPFDITVP